MKRCLITGGAGFIGSHLVQSMVETGWAVTVLDNLSTGNEANLTCVTDRIDFITDDIRDKGAVLHAAKGTDVVFHLAALVSVQQSVENPTLSAEINDIGTLNVFEAANHAGARRVVYSSSCAVYGDGDGSRGVNPQSPYAAHKLLGEHYGRFFSDVRGLEVAALRYYNVFGPRQDPSSAYSGVISIFIDKLMAGQVPMIYGDGEQTRDFVFVSDVVRANMLAAAAERAPANAINIGTGVAVSINKLYSTIAKIIQSEIEPGYGPAREGEIRNSCADVSSANEALGFSSETGLAEGLMKTVQWAKGQ
jgi:UDP-glucose 4-epimerase